MNDPRGAISISGESCMQTVEHLHRVGIRVAGTSGEKQAADWIEGRFRELGLARVNQQEFPCLSFGHTRVRLEAKIAGRWKTIDAEPAAHSPATPAEGIEGELVFVEQLPSGARARAELLEGKVVLTYCSVLFQLHRLERIMNARPRAILLVDDRLPVSWTVAVGFPRAWVELLTCPIVNVAYTSAWDLVRKEVKSVRLLLDSFVKESVSQNVIAEIPGTASADEIIVLSCHHDSVANNPGADDNATGVAAVLELARAFADRAPRRTLRFISFGTEEQLSEGALYYALHAPDVKDIRFVLNTDSIGAWMGQTKIFYAGPPALRRFIEEVNREMSFPVELIHELSPFSDHFPLNLQGIPAIWYYRPTFGAARHFHHSRLETPEVVSPAVLEATVRHQARLLDRVACEPTMPFPLSLTSTQVSRLRRMAREWCRLEL